MPEKGDLAPDFTLPTLAGEFHLAQALHEGPVVVAFYAEDSTPACTQELAAFRDEYDTLKEFGARVIAISADSLDSHEKMDRRLSGLPFPLATDEDLSVAKSYGVADEAGVRCHLAVFVVYTDGVVAHANPWYQPRNPAQFLDVFTALGLELG